MSHWVLYLWRFDPYLQAVAVVLSVVGISVSIWLASQAHRDYVTVSQNGLAERLVARSHRRSQFVMLTIQVGFGVISYLVLWLPPIGGGMSVYPGGDYVLTVILTRKIIRASLVLLLTVAAIRQARDRQHILALLAGQSL